MQWYKLRTDEVERSTNTDLRNGLSKEEVQERIKKVGYNELVEARKKSLFITFLEQFKDFMVLILFGATCISMLLGEWVDAIAILAIVLLNGVLGFIQENRAEKSLQALKQLAAPQVTTLRGGVWEKVPSREVVLGDVIRFSSGDRIGADARIIECSSLQIEESALTGESVPAQKGNQALREDDISLGDQENMAFMGTLVTRGHGMGIVTDIGMNTAMGQIASLIQDTKEAETPLQKRLAQLGKVLIILALALTVLVVAIGIFQGQAFYKMVLAGVSLAVAAIPEGLPAIVTVALSLGVQKLIRKKAIVRKLPSVETLGCASVICSDKTGTMTQNKMMVTNLWTNNQAINLTGSGYKPEGKFYKNDTEIQIENEKAFVQLVTFGMLCNTADIQKKGKEFILDGDPTEGALVVAAMKAGITREVINSQFEILQEFPFDSSRKMMSVVVQDRSGNRFVVVKGAPDIIVDRCESILWNNKTQPINEVTLRSVNEEIDSKASLALRNIAIAYKMLTPSQASIKNENEAESKLTFIGLESMIDPPRPEVANAVKECNEAGIKTIMVTGDHATTAKAIAEQLGILAEGGRVVEGRELSTMSVSDLEEIVDDVYVFARVSPLDKLKIVHALQNRGHIVAMTGDGVNDAPAIKAADIGISMGITGTDVAKEASSLILVDDNFATIKTAIKEGRNIYENIRKFIRYLLASNVGEILVMLFAMLLGLPLPLQPVQILWVNLVTDGLPAMALGVDPAENNVMKRRPRHPNEGIFSRGLGWKIISRGILIGIVTLISFIIAYNQHPTDLQYAQTIAFATLVISQLILVFDCRSEYSILHRNIFSNLYLVGAVLISVLSMLVVIYYEPLQPIFDTKAIVARDWLLILGLSAIPTFLLAGAGLHRKKS